MALDDPDAAIALLERMLASCPIEATCLPGFLSMLRAQAAFATAGPRCVVSKVNYMGDAGGIVCRLDFGLGEGKPAPVVSITHLLFDGDHPLADDIAAYQKHRITRLREQSA